MRGDDRARAWLREIRRHRLERFASAGTVLEFQPRDVHNLTTLQARRKIACAPRADVAAMLAPHGVEVFERLDLVPADIIDLLLCDHVLEYQMEPRETLIAIARVLKPGGALLVQALYDPDFCQPRLDHEVEHYYSWNVQTLGVLLTDCGYEFLDGRVVSRSDENRNRSLKNFFSRREELRIEARKPG